MQVERTIFGRLALLFSYPEGPFQSYLEQVEVLLRKRPDLLQKLASFANFVRENQIEALEERFTLTFDLNPKNCLEVGWHLYGEDYKRGQFLVRMRSALCEHGIPESVELPDHLRHCLQLLSCLDEEESGLFVSVYLGPALSRIARGLSEADIYRGPIEVLRQLLSEIASVSSGVEDSLGRETVFELPVLNEICG